MGVRIVHVNPEQFYILFNTIRLYYTQDYNIKKYGLYNNKFKRSYITDSTQKIYNNTSIDIKNIELAKIHIIANFLQNKNTYITNFSLQAAETLLKYILNKQTIINDFKGEIQNALISKIKSGQLYDDIILHGYKPELFAVINCFIPIVELSKSYSSYSDNLSNILFGKNSSSAIEKSKFLLINYFEKDKEQITKTLKDLLKTEKTEKTDIQTEKTEDTEYDYFYC